MTTAPMSTSISKDTRQEQMQQISARLVEQVAAIQDSDTFKAYLSFQAKFHRYSANNTLLIMLQSPDALHVAGYETWKTMNRQVKKGEKAIKIYAPIMKKDERGEPAVLGFRLANVFDISQTDGDPIPTLEVLNLVGEEGADLYAALCQFTANHGYTLTNTPPRPTRANGIYNPKTRAIFIKQQAQLQMTKTLAHELAHALDPELAADRDRRHEMETVAEGAAFLVLAHFGLECGDYSFTYIADWNGTIEGRATLLECMQRIQKIARTIIDGATTILIPPTQDSSAAQVTAA